MASHVIADSRARVAAYRLPILLASLIALGVIAGVAIGLGNWAVVAALCLLPLVLLKPVEVAMGIFVFMIPFDSVASVSGQGSGRTLLWFAGAFAGCVLLAVGLVGNRLQRPPRTTLWWTLFVLWGAASFLWAYNPEAVVQRLPTALGLLGLYIAATCFRIRKNEMDWIVLMTLAGSLIAAVATLYAYSHGMYFEGTKQRASLVLGPAETNPNFLAIAFVLPITLAIAQFMSLRSRPVRWLIVCVAGIDTLALLLTMSRGALLALLVAILIFCLRLRADRRVIVLAVLMGCLTLAMPSIFFHRIKEAAEHGNSRVDIWKAGLVAAEHYGLIGAGMDNFHLVYPKFAGFAPTFMGYDRDSHNIYLAIVVDGGIIALLFFLLAVNAQRKLLSSSNNDRTPRRYLIVACEAAFWAMLVYGFTGNILWLKTFWFSWIMLAFALRVAADSEPKLEPLHPFNGAVRMNAV